MPQRISRAQEKNFWRRWDVEIGEELEVGPLPLSVQLEAAG